MAFKKRRFGKRRISRRPVVRRRVMRKGKAYRKNRASHVKVKSLGLNTSFSKVALRPNKFGVAMRKKYWLGARNIYVSDVLTSAACSAGLAQDYVQVGYFDKTDLYQSVATLANAPGATGSANNNSRYFFNKVTAEVIMTNASNINAEIDIYSFSTKHDTGISPAALFAQGLQDQTSQTLTDVSRQYGMTPFDSAGVAQMFKCYKVTHLQLNPGQSHRHSFTSHICRPIGNEIIKNANDNILSGLRGITHYELYIVRSTAVVTGTGGVGEAMTGMKVNMNVNKKYELKYLFDNNTNMATSYSTPASTGLQVYNQGTGAAATPAVI